MICSIQESMKFMDNVVDFSKFKEKKEEEIPDKLHTLSTDIVNYFLDDILPKYGVDMNKIEASQELLFFVEALKSMLFYANDHYHPFQDEAEDFCTAYNVQVVEHEGGYDYKIGMDDNNDEN